MNPYPGERKRINPSEENRDGKCRFYEEKISFCTRVANFVLVPGNGFILGLILGIAFGIFLATH